MMPYVESGKLASRKLAAPVADHRREYCFQRLRGFKQVINLLSASAIITIPIIGVMTRSPALAAVTALGFLLLVCLLELGERSVKRELDALCHSNPAESPES